MLQLCIDWIDLIKHKLVHPQAKNNCMPSQTCVSKSESVVVRWVEMIVCDEWMWCGVDVVWCVKCMVVHGNRKQERPKAN